MVEGQDSRRRQRLRNPWAFSLHTLLTTVVGFAALFLMVQSFLTKQLDVKGCEMSYMRPAYSKFADFDTEHTRFASKYSLYLYREGGIDEDFTVCVFLKLGIPMANTG
jgi:glycosylphosphatidylinositol deacylase